MEKDGRRGRGFSHVLTGRHETLATNAVITLCFIALLLLAIVLSFVIITSERLRLENSVERAYSSVFLALSQGSIDSAVLGPDVLGFGYYSSTGNALYTWGDAYQRLPITRFPDASDSYVTSYDEARGMIESVRYVSDTVLVPENLFRNGGGVLEYPDILYLAFNAVPVVSRIRLVTIVAIISVAAILLLYIIVLQISAQNREYRMKLQRQQNLVSLGEAARTLTHEIKNPLSAIRLQLALLKREADPSLLDDIMVIDQETARLTELTDRVSDFIRNPLGTPEKVDLVSTIENLIPLFSHRIIFLPPPSRPLYVMFDPARLRSVVENLLKNAIEATEGDAPVECSIMEERNMYRVAVRDRGVGMRDVDKSKIFDPFYTTKINGSGIGLSIASQFLAAAGGSIALYKREGGGTSAEFTVPVSGRVI